MGRYWGDLLSVAFIADRAKGNETCRAFICASYPWLGWHSLY